MVEGADVDGAAAVPLLRAHLPGGLPRQLTRHLRRHHLTTNAGQPNVPEQWTP